MEDQKPTPEQEAVIKALRAVKAEAERIKKRDDDWFNHQIDRRSEKR